MGDGNRTVDAGGEWAAARDTASVFRKRPEGMKSRWPTALDGVAVRAGYRIWVRLLACRRLGLAVKKILGGYHFGAREK